MRNLIIAFVLIFSNEYLFSTDCKDKSFPYRCCDGTVKCLTDPANQTNPKVMKALGKICISLSDNSLYSGPSSVTMPDFDLDGYYVDSEIYNADDFSNDKSCAESNWPDICKMDDICWCVVTVAFVDDKTIFQNYSNGMPKRYSATNINIVINGNNCQPDCNTLIALNNTSAMWRVDQDGLVHGGFYNNDNTHWNNLSSVISHQINDPKYKSSDVTTQYFAVNLCDVLTHELGLLYGLEEHSDYPCNTPTEATEMNNTVNNAPSLGITALDYCAFSKLYCPDAEGVVDTQKNNNDFGYNPNPFDNNLKINFYISNIESEVKIRIYNLLGEIILQTNDIYYSAGNHSLNIDGTQFPSGVYYLQITIGEITNTKKIIKTK